MFSKLISTLRGLLFYLISTYPMNYIDVYHQCNYWSNISLKMYNLQMNIGRCTLTVARPCKCNCANRETSKCNTHLISREATKHKEIWITTKENPKYATMKEFVALIAT